MAEIFPNSISFQKIEILEALVFWKLAGDWNSSSPRYAWDFPVHVGKSGSGREDSGKMEMVFCYNCLGYSEKQ